MSAMKRARTTCKEPKRLPLPVGNSDWTHVVKKVWNNAAHRAEQGRYPVLHITLKDAKGSTWDLTKAFIRRAVGDEFRRHESVFSSKRCGRDWKAVSEAMRMGTADDETITASLGIIAGMGAVSPDLLAMLPPPVSPDLIPDKTGAVKVRLIFAYHIPNDIQAKPDWPNVGYDFRPAMKNMTDTLNWQIPGVVANDLDDRACRTKIVARHGRLFEDGACLDQVQLAPRHVHGRLPLRRRGVRQEDRLPGRKRKLKEKRWLNA